MYIKVFEYAQIIIQGKLNLEKGRERISYQNFKPFQAGNLHVTSAYNIYTLFSKQVLRILKPIR